MNTMILSTDVKALYPSLDIEFTTDMVCQMYKESQVTIEGLDYEELGLYLSLNLTEAEQIEKGIREYCATRKTTLGRKPNITGCGSELKKEDRFKPWNPPKKIVGQEDTEIKKRLMTEALRIAIKFVMKNHTYTFKNKIYKQEEGGAIGVELTGDLAKVFMVWWSRQLQQKKTDEYITTYLYKCYVDDINMLVSIPSEVDTMNINVDERAKEGVKVIKRIGNSVHESIVLEADFPDNNSDKKLPSLDLKVWLKERNNRKFIMHEFYMKAVSSIAVVNARSSLPWKMKRTILVQQTIRILRNCSEDLPWEVKEKHLNHMMKRLQYSGYNQRFRYEVLTSALHAFEEMKRKDRNGEKPLYRHKQWRRKERRKEKEMKKKNWYKNGGYESVIFVPCTQDSELMRRLQKDINKSDLKIKLVEKAGTTLGNLLRTSDPKKERKCNRPDCPVCTSGGKGDCRTLDVNYEMRCECDGKYTGTTTRSAYVRGKEQTNDLHSRNEDSDLWKHCREKHDGEIKQFRMDVVDTFKRDPMLRQITESVRISRTDERRLINAKEEYDSTRRR